MKKFIGISIGLPVKTDLDVTRFEVTVAREGADPVVLEVADGPVLGVEGLEGTKGTITVREGDVKNWSEPSDPTEFVFEDVIAPSKPGAATVACVSQRIELEPGDEGYVPPEPPPEPPAV